jgi:hypothetical protein
VANTDWAELTVGEQPAVRVSARDLQQAQRARARIRDKAAVSVVLDITVLVDDDYRSAQRRMSALHDGSRVSMEYAGTLDGLAGLVDDIVAAGVADGVTLIAAAPQQDVRALGEATLARLRPLSHARSGVQCRR